MTSTCSTPNETHTLTSFVVSNLSTFVLMLWANSVEAPKFRCIEQTVVEASKFWFFAGMELKHDFFGKIEEQIAVNWPLAFWWVEWIRLVCTWNLGQVCCTIPILITQFFSHSQAHFWLLDLTLLTSWNFREACVLVNSSGSGLYLKNKGVSLISQSRTAMKCVGGFALISWWRTQLRCMVLIRKIKQESIDSFHPALDAH